MIALNPGIFSNCLSAVTTGSPKTMAYAAIMASGNFSFTFCLMSITFLLMAGEMSTTVHWPIKAFVFMTSSGVMPGLLSNSSSVMKDTFVSIPCNNSAKCLSPLSRYMAMLVSQKACRSIPFIAHTFLRHQTIFFPLHRAAKLFSVQLFSLLQLAHSNGQLLPFCLRVNVDSHGNFALPIKDKEYFNNRPQPQFDRPQFTVHSSFSTDHRPINQQPSTNNHFTSHISNLISNISYLMSQISYLTQQP